MGVTSRLAELMGRVAGESDISVALDAIAEAAVENTGSRNAMIALMNDAQGRLEIRHGFGPEWDLLMGPDEDMHIDVNTNSGIVAYVAATGSTVLTGDVTQEPRYENLFLTTHSEMAVPIRDSEKRIRAVLNVESERANAYSPKERAACEVLANIAAMVIDRHRSSEREEALIEVGAALASALTEEELVARVIGVAGEVLRFQACSIFLLDLRTDRFVLRGSVGQLKGSVGVVSYARGEGCTGCVCRDGEPIRLDRPQDDPRWRGRHLEFPQDQIAHFLAVPVISKGKSIGAIRVIRREASNPHLDNRFSQSDERVLESIAEQMAAGLENIRIVNRMLGTERMAAWGELSAKSSHMIGNRVFALKGDVNELGFLLEGNPLDLEAVREIHRSLGANVMRVEEILQDFRDFLTATQLTPEPGDVNDLIRETVAEVFPKRGPASLRLDLADGLPLALIDGKKLRRAVSELIENALGYMSEGELTVRTSLAENAKGRIGGKRGRNSYVRIEVEDDGPGVSSEHKGRIFQPFYTGRVKGMGLGLSIVKGIVDAHGGAVFEEGEVGDGAKFVILVPLAERL